MLIYNVNGTVTDIQITAIVDGKITSSAVIPANIPDSFNAATASATITNAITYNSSSADAYMLAYPTDKTGWTSIGGVLTSPKNR